MRTGLARFCADEVDISLLPNVGYQWLPKSEPVAVLTPGTHEKCYVAGARNLRTGTIQHGVWYRKPTGLFLDLLTARDRVSPVPQFTRLSVVVDHAKIHTATEVEKWWAAPPRFEGLFLPPSCPKASPSARAFGAVHDKGTRNPKRKRSRDLVGDVEQHLPINGPWPSVRSDLSYTPAGTAAVQALMAAETPPEETSQLAA